MRGARRKALMAAYLQFNLKDMGWSFRALKRFYKRNARG